MLLRQLQEHQGTGIWGIVLNLLIRMNLIKMK